MAKSKPKPFSPFAGRWRIVSMSAWDQDFVDEEEDGYFEFDERGGGEFHFGYVHGQVSCLPATRDGEPAHTRLERRGEVVPRRRQAGPGLWPHRDRRPGGVRLRRPGQRLRGVVFEDDKPATLAEAMAALEKGLAERFKREGIE